MSQREENRSFTWTFLPVDTISFFDYQQTQIAVTYKTNKMLIYALDKRRDDQVLKNLHGQNAKSPRR